MSERECDLCQWPAVAGEFGDGYCRWHQRLMRWWVDSYAWDHYAMTGRRWMAFLCAVRDKLRVIWIAETAYALMHGGPFHFEPWATVARWICSVRDHEPVHILTARDNGNRVYRCKRCRAEALLEVGRMSYAAFRRDARHEITIWCGFDPASPRGEG